MAKFVDDVFTPFNVVSEAIAGSFTCVHPGKYVTPLPTKVTLPALVGIGCSATAVLAVPVCHKDAIGALNVSGAPVLKLKMPPSPQFSVTRPTQPGARLRNALLGPNGNVYVPVAVNIWVRSNPARPCSRLMLLL